ncbi:DNA/RNA non-specific endonuclease [Rhizobium sp. 25PS6]|uniref:DNA/RNA non-specific endonuclease n=1 Tax=Rhizobium TaxID=379 RepID=UPI00144273DC|nr:MULTISPECIES: DNA/RNA non-specific endonuclease [Rhizobium]MBY3181840.1 DNA/RNA non-specific endonuclease [Rhizobium laguerreae]MBY3221502.1 DNA/RNA non-specific endonuclease [Rhizobium laguerreae]MDU0305932.1 DNA/RNA non-specific endonuclease [Rhizobium sp. 10PS4]MDU0359005.1 DNA/RNA non-specific endonuclease [Rhizobium sp. 25PS6]NKM23404.1 DNA/RNA non-specific endonuclease [Rhizobium laguerreae]
MTIDLTHKPRLADLTRLGGPADIDSQAALNQELESVEARGQPKRTPAASFSGRAGYVEDFLGFTVPLPTPLGELKRFVAPVSGSSEGRLDYEHFSVVMHSARRLAMFVAVNIDGAHPGEVERKNDKWFLDGRIADEFQIGEDLYADNILDRGHLVRRQDPVWGKTAATANGDTFHFTNCSPQAANFNQKTWLSLEDYVLGNAKVQDTKVSVFTGPVFRDSDRTYRGVQIPTAYWKVLSFVNDAGRPSSTAYIVDQVSELKHLEAVFGAFKTYQRSVASIQRMTGLSFNGLADFDGFTNEEAATRTAIIAELRSPADIRV